MKKLKIGNSIIETEIGYDQVNGWVVSPNVQEIEFEDGTILENPEYDPDWVPNENN